MCEFDGVLITNGKWFFITFIDDWSNFTFVYFMKNKSGAFDMFKLFVFKVENRVNKKIIKEIFNW